MVSPNTKSSESKLYTTLLVSIHRETNTDQTYRSQVSGKISATAFARILLINKIADKRDKIRIHVRTNNFHINIE